MTEEKQQKPWIFFLILLVFLVIGISTGWSLAEISRPEADCDYIYIDYEHMEEIDSLKLAAEIISSNPTWVAFGEVVNRDLIISIPFKREGVNTLNRIKVEE